MNPRDVPIPALMKHLKLDHRGYPIFPLIVRDASGPKFAVNDEVKRQQFLRDDRCGVCGNKLHRARWLVGGPGSAFLEHGAYLDPPMHGECLHYAMKVCPYLAAPRWSGAVGMKQAASVKYDHAKLVVIDQADPIFPDRPKVFVAVQYIGNVKLPRGPDGLPVIVPPKPYRRMEYWIGGEQLDDVEGALLAGAIVAEMETKVAEVRAEPPQQ